MDHHRSYRWLALLVMCAVLSHYSLSVLAGDPDSWLSFGKDRFNSRRNSAQSAITRASVPGLSLRWVFNASGDVSATPTVEDGRVYFSDFGGALWCLNSTTGAVLWTRDVVPITGVAGDYSRTAPILAGDFAVYAAAQLNSSRLFALNKTDGSLLWVTRIEDHPLAWITASPGYYAPTGLVIVGTSSTEAGAALDPLYPCCNFRASYVAVRVTTGAVVWKTYMVPEGYSGAPSWGAGIAYEPGTVFVTTGQGYSAPEDVNQCIRGSVMDDSYAGPDQCVASDVHINSIVALDASDGHVRWSYRSASPDFFTIPCLLIGPDHPGCNHPPGFDVDFSMSPMLVPRDNGAGHIVVALSKSGYAFAVDSATGALEWATVVGPGSNANGFYGGAWDRNGIYLVAPNARKTPWITWERGLPTSRVTGFSLITRLRIRDGRIDWQVPDRHLDLGDQNTQADASGGFAVAQTVNMIDGKTTAPLTVANGVLFTCTMSTGGRMYALDTRDGSVLWTHEGNVGSCNSGPSVVEGWVLWGSGYARFDLGTGDRLVYAFGV